MTKTINKHISFSILKFSSLFIVTGGVILWDQIRRAKNKINEASSPHVLVRTKQQPQFIYIADSKSEDLLRKFEIGGVTNELYKITQLYLWLTGKFKGSQLYEDIFSIHQNLAWRFLELSQNEDYYYRQKAVRTLATMHDLSDSTCTQLAQASDLRTATGLARTDGVDVRLLLDPPNWRKQPNEKSIIVQLHHLLLALDKEVPHPCLQYVISKSFVERDHKGFDDDVGFNINQPDVIPKCIEALLHHSWISRASKSFIQLGGLALLVEIYKLLRQKEDTETLGMLSRILSNISMDQESHNYVYMSGCVKILAYMLQHNDMRVNIPAARALMNLDRDTPDPNSVSPTFLRNVYALHPIHRRSGEPPSVDVIYVHGLLGSVFVTWRQRDEDSIVTNYQQKNIGLNWSFLPDLGIDVTDLPTDCNVNLGDVFSRTRHLPKQELTTKRTQCWPRDWLPEDCPDVRVLGVNYDTNLSMWSPMCPIAPARHTLDDRSNHLAEVLEKAGVGSRPIIWVAHSMGGLIVKDLLCKSMSSGDSPFKTLADKTEAIIFFSTPHKGSRLATWNATSQMIIWPSIEVKELRQDSPVLLELHRQFMSFTKEHPIRVVSFAEREATYVKALKMKFRFVEDESAVAGVGESYGIPLDHLCVCKPADRTSFLYQKVIEVINQVVKQEKERRCKKDSS